MDEKRLQSVADALQDPQFLQFLHAARTQANAGQPASSGVNSSTLWPSSTPPSHVTAEPDLHTSLLSLLRKALGQNAQSPSLSVGTDSTAGEHPSSASSASAASHNQHQNNSKSRVHSPSFSPSPQSSEYKLDTQQASLSTFEHQSLHPSLLQPSNYASQFSVHPSMSSVQMQMMQQYFLPSHPSTQLLPPPPVNPLAHAASQIYSSFTAGPAAGLGSSLVPDYPSEFRAHIESLLSMQQQQQQFQQQNHAYAFSSTATAPSLSLPTSASSQYRPSALEFNRVKQELPMTPDSSQSHPLLASSKFPYPPPAASYASAASQLAPWMSNAPGGRTSEYTHNFSGAAFPSASDLSAYSAASVYSMPPPPMPYSNSTNTLASDHTASSNTATGTVGTKRKSSASGHRSPGDESSLSASSSPRGGVKVVSSSGSHQAQVHRSSSDPNSMVSEEESIEARKLKVAKLVTNRHPKNPRSAYVFFVAEERKRLAKSEEIQKTPFREMAQRLGQRWQQMTFEEKKPYITLAKMDRERFQREKEDFVQAESQRMLLEKEQNLAAQNASRS